MGMRASGKSTIGRLLADRMDRSLIDLDLETLRAFPDCATISKAWQTHGESAFRIAENIALARVIDAGDSIIALGGGTPLQEENRQRLIRARDRGDAMLIYLKADALTLRTRLAADRGDRPALRGVNAIDEVDEILREREPIYAMLASVTLDAAQSSEELVEKIVAAAHG